MARAPRTNASGPRDGMKSMDYKPGDAGSYKSSSAGGKGGFSGIRDTSGGTVQQLKRSAPNVGIVQSGNNNRGGAATSNYDRAPDKDCTYMAPGLEELRAKQDRARGRQND